MSKLAGVYRGGRLESSHSGHIAVVNSDGKLLYFAGDPYRLTYARSSVKPIQAIPVVETGAADKFGLTDIDLAVICSSHNGELQHTDRVLSILNKAKIGVEALQCGTHIPLAMDVYEKLIREGKEPTPLYNNCSGKHAGMLLTAKHMGETLEDYYKPEHPVQQRILKVISVIAEYQIDKIGIGKDGCGAPVHAMPLERLAYSFARLADPKTLGNERAMVIKKITTAMTDYPEMVGGTGRFCTDFMKVAKGRLFGKLGAESVYLIGDKKLGIGIAIKIEDGSYRALYPTALEILRQLNILTREQLEQLMPHYMPKLKNARGEEVGEIIPSFELKG
ncbi:MAG: asparaginase [Candidatus Atribacteria bacterium]|nr:asparaginase [Candidatus Atribacteria bacterium]